MDLNSTDDEYKPEPGAKRKVLGSKRDGTPRSGNKRNSKAKSMDADEITDEDISGDDDRGKDLKESDDENVVRAAKRNTTTQNCRNEQLQDDLEQKFTSQLTPDEPLSRESPIVTKFEEKDGKTSLGSLEGPGKLNAEDEGKDEAKDEVEKNTRRNHAEDDRWKLSQAERKRRHKDFLASLYSLYQINPESQNAKRRKTIASSSTKRKPWSRPSLAQKSSPSPVNTADQEVDIDAGDCKRSKATDLTVWDLDDIQEPTPLPKRSKEIDFRAFSAPAKSCSSGIDKDTPKRGLMSVLATSTPVPVQMSWRQHKGREVDFIIPTKKGKELQNAQARKRERDSKMEEDAPKKRSISPSSTTKHTDAKKRKIQDNVRDLLRHDDITLVEQTQAGPPVHSKESPTGKAYVDDTQQQHLSPPSVKQEPTNQTPFVHIPAPNVSAPLMEVVFEDDEDDEIDRMIVGTPGLCAVRRMETIGTGSRNASPSLRRALNSVSRRTSSTLRIPSTIPAFRSSSPDAGEPRPSAGIVAGFTPYPKAEQEPPDTSMRFGLRLENTPSGPAHAIKKPASFLERVSLVTRGDDGANGDQRPRNRQQLRMSIEIADDDVISLHDDDIAAETSKVCV